MCVTCTCIGRDRWPVGCCLQFSDGERMHVVDRVPLQYMGSSDRDFERIFAQGPAVVLPGDSMQVSVEFVAPSQPNTYLSRWRLRTASGMPFGGINLNFVYSIRNLLNEYDYIESRTHGRTNGIIVVTMLNLNTY